jgi:hypothetical protein
MTNTVKFETQMSDDGKSQYSTKFPRSCINKEEKRNVTNSNT